MKVIFHEPKDPDLFEAARTLYTQHQDFTTQQDNDNGCSFYNKKLGVCIVIDHPYSLESCSQIKQ